MRNDNLNGLSDDELVQACHDGEEGAVPALISRFEPLVRSKAAWYSSHGAAEADDLVQEGLMALIKAVFSYKCSGEASFVTYAGVCIANRFRTVLRDDKSSREEPESDIGEETVSEHTPETIVLEKERTRELYGRMAAKLSKLEQDIFIRYLSGKSCAEISDEMGITPKSADNALQRVRRKLKKAFKE